MLNRRIHHGEIGVLLFLSCLVEKSYPIPSHILSGLEKGLMDDDHCDRREWFTFKKKPEQEY
jgi:hypothetical protein